MTGGGTQILEFKITNKLRGTVSTVDREYLSRVGTLNNIQTYYLNPGNGRLNSPGVELQMTGYEQFVRTNPRLGRTLLSASFDHLSSSCSSGVNMDVLNHNS